MAFNTIVYDDLVDRALLFAVFSAFAWLGGLAGRSLSEKRLTRPGPLKGPWLPWYGAMGSLSIALHGALAATMPDWLLLAVILVAPVAADCLWKLYACRPLGIDGRDRSSDFLHWGGFMSLRAAACWAAFTLACLYLIEPLFMDAIMGAQARLKSLAAGAILSGLAIDASAFLGKTLRAIKRPTRP